MLAIYLRLRRALCVVLLLASAVIASTEIAEAGSHIGRRRGTGVVLPRNWATQMRFLGLFEEAANADALDASGNGNTLTDTNSIARDTTNYREGAKAASFTGSSNEYFSCTDANCGGTSKLDMAGNFSAGCWIRPDTTTANMQILAKFVTSNGYRMFLQSSDVLRCQVGSSGNTNTADSTGTITDGTMAHAICVATGSDYRLYINGVLDNTVTPGTYRNPADVSGAFFLSDNSASTDFNGQMDLCFVDDTAWGAKDVCRGCAIGIGKDTVDFENAKGECDTVTEANYKPCSANSECNGGVGICTAKNAENNCIANADCTSPGQPAACCTNSGTGTCTGSCCMGYKNLYCGGCDLPACDLTGPAGS